jgi:hypothetical protein
MNILGFVKNNLFNVILGFCVVFILLFGLYNVLSGKRGSWSSCYTYVPPRSLLSSDMNFDKKQPKESKGEKECRYVLESVFNRTFNKYRPNFLNNPVTGGEHNLELDCYNPELKLAVEYNGIQHEKFIPYFHKNKEAFLNQKYRDLLKKKLCEENGIVLITVPHTVKNENIRNYLLKKLQGYGYI